MKVDFTKMDREALIDVIHDQQVAILRLVAARDRARNTAVVYESLLAKNMDSR